MNLEEFNLASSDEATTFLKQCVQIQSWSEDLLSQRPFENVEEILNLAKKQVLTWTWEDIESALNNHPRIGEKKAHANLSEKEQVFSKKEQAAIKQSMETQQALLEGNIAYEKKFGHIFLIRALGLDSTQILQALNYRLLNDVETERRIVKQQLGEITLLRLSNEIAPVECI